jgi:hypothetical protein
VLFVRLCVRGFLWVAKETGASSIVLIPTVLLCLDSTQGVQIEAANAACYG